MIEAQVHSSLRDLLRVQGQYDWPHHLTMARLVARALRLGRSALIQTGSTQTKYCLSYLTPALLWQGSLILVTPVSTHQQLLQESIPLLQRWLGTNKPVAQVTNLSTIDRNSGLIVTAPEDWLRGHLQGQSGLLLDLPTLIDKAEDLEEWTRVELTASIDAQFWQLLMSDYPQFADLIRDTRIQLTKAIFARPANPYECYLLADSEQEHLRHLLTALPSKTDQWQQWYRQDQLLWASVARAQGNFTLHCAPAQVSTTLQRIWQRQSVVLMGGFLDPDTKANVYRQQLGLSEDLTCVKFSANRRNEHIQLYIPDFFPLPNTRKFSAALLKQLHSLLRSGSEWGTNLSQSRTNFAPPRRLSRLVVVLIEDVPLKAQVGANLASEFGSLVQVEKTNLAPEGILISGWQFWRNHQEQIPTPQLLVIATLPFPSLEHPLVAGRVAYHKSQRQDWFRLYLLPSALREIQRAVLPLRELQGVVALLDSRVNYRSYGNDILNALEPYARINYLDGLW